MNHQIRIDKADNDRRTLARGYTWQDYIVSAVKRIRKQDFITLYNGKTADLKSAYDEWEQTVHRFIVGRSRQLGLWVGGAVGQLVEEPNESKLLEVYIWENGDTHCVFSIHGIVRGPVKQEEHVEKPMPLFGFWPWDIKKIGDIPEVIDAAKLTAREQGIIA